MHPTPSSSRTYGPFDYYGCALPGPLPGSVKHIEL